MRDEIRVDGIFQRFASRWPWMIGLGILGFVLAFVFSMVKPAVYQSEAILMVSVHYGVSEPLALIVEDRALDRVASFIESDQVVALALNQLPENLRAEQKWNAPAAMDAILHLDRRMTKWALQARHPEPAVAQQVAQAWAEAALDALGEAQSHARMASRLLESEFIIDCDETIVEEMPTQIWECVAFPGEGATADIDQALQDEIDLSNGVLPNITFDLHKDARLPTSPILYQRAWLLSAGTIAGWVLGLILLVSAPMHDPGDRRDESRRA